jgi:hypothetical protein
MFSTKESAGELTVFFPSFSGTNGYVVRNLSHLRSHDTAADRANMDSAPMKHREPDKEILEHERKRKIEVACYELQVQLEDDGYVLRKPFRSSLLIAFVSFSRSTGRLKKRLRQK